MKSLPPLYKRFKCPHLQDLVSIVSMPYKKNQSRCLFLAYCPHTHTSGKSCWANHANTKKKCTASIVTNNKSVPAPTYTGMWHHYKLQSMKRTDFVFCPDDIERCVKGPRQKWVMPFSGGKERPPISQYGPSRLEPTSPVRRSSSLKTQDFQFPPKEHITPT